MIRVCLDLNGKKFLYRSKGIIVMRKGVIDKTRLKSNVALIFMRSMVLWKMIDLRIELSSETGNFERPIWLGEVTNILTAITTLI
jgi:hypothetical protein